MAGSGTAHLRDRDDIVLRVEHAVISFGTRHGRIRAVSDVSLDVADGETLGLVGESGCGKSTLVRAICRLAPLDSGRVVLEGDDLTQKSGRELRRSRLRMQMVFQDPRSALNPRRRVGEIIAEPLDVWDLTDAASRSERVGALLEAVGLDPTAASRYPHEFSGGQAQRISIARALAPRPAVLICDEPVSALDVSIQAQILNLLEDLKSKFGLTILFIAHDLAVVRHVSDRVAVMYLGKLCEVADSDDLYRSPAHPYTAALLAAVPQVSTAFGPPPEPGLSGELPSPVDPPSGCRFRTRCPRARDRCSVEEPELREIGEGHVVACHFPIVA